MKLKCDKCGEIDHVLVDGYEFGDRLLEGVNFIVEDRDGKPHAIGVDEQARDYFNDLNTKKWLEACEEFCQDLDIAQCPKCFGDVVVWGNPIVTGKTPPPATVIPILRGNSLIERIMRKQAGGGGS
jgi:hypothetical protein